MKINTHPFIERRRTDRRKMWFERGFDLDAFARDVNLTLLYSSAVAAVSVIAWCLV